MIFDFKIKTTSQLAELKNFLLVYLPKQVNLANTSKNDDLFALASHLSSIDTPTTICLHYSIANNYHGNLTKAIDRFLGFVDWVERVNPKLNILLVSGGQKKKLTTADLLEFYKSTLPTIQRRFGVVFNPFHSDLESEQQALRRKLNTGLVDSLYFQLGDDLTKLQQGLELVKTELEASGLNQTIRLFGSVLYVTRWNLLKLQFRPLAGVFYSRSFFSSELVARQINQQIISLYQNFGFAILWEFITIPQAAQLMIESHKSTN